MSLGCRAKSHPWVWPDSSYKALPLGLDGNLPQYMHCLCVTPPVSLRTRAL